MEENKNFTKKSRRREGRDIDLVDLIRVIWSKATLILLIGIIGAAIGLFLSMCVLPEKYESTTTIYVLNRDENSKVISANEMQTGSQLTRDYSIMITSRYVMEKVIDELQLDMSPSELRENISITVPSQTRAINITVTDRDPAQAQQIANAVREEASEHIKTIMAVNAVNVVDEANYPSGRSSPRVSVWVLVSALVGMFLYISFLTFRFILDDTLKTSEDIDRHLDLSTLALIPLDEGINMRPTIRKSANNSTKGAENDLAISDLEQHDQSGDLRISTREEQLAFQTREAFKTLRSNIEFSGERIKIINVTSCTPNEGKSEISFELAKSFAENGKKVLLFDADMRNSAMRSHFKRGKIAYGLSHYLVGSCSENEILFKTDIKNFYIVFSGPKTPSPAELLDSDRFSCLLEAVSAAYDIIIIDSPPLGNVIDAAIIAKKCNGTILVVSSSVISFRLAQSVVEQLKRSGCRILGCVLNKVNMKDASFYGKYYGEYGGNIERKAKKSEG